MTELGMLWAYLSPMMVIAGAAWRIAVKLTTVERKLEGLERENQRLRSDLVSLQTLLSVLVDSRRSSGS
jgi:hypothetical protein